MVKTFDRLLISFALFYIVALPCEAPAQLAKVTTSYVSDSAGVLPLWIAKEFGLFSRGLYQGK